MQRGREHETVGPVPHPGGPDWHRGDAVRPGSAGGRCAPGPARRQLVLPADGRRVVGGRRPVGPASPAGRAAVWRGIRRHGGLGTGRRRAGILAAGVAAGDARRAGDAGRVDLAGAATQPRPAPRPRGLRRGHTAAGGPAGHGGVGVPAAPGGHRAGRVTGRGAGRQGQRAARLAALGQHHRGHPFCRVGPDHLGQHHPARGSLDRAYRRRAAERWLRRRRPEHPAADRRHPVPVHAAQPGGGAGRGQRQAALGVRPQSNRAELAALPWPGLFRRRPAAGRRAHHRCRTEPCRTEPCGTGHGRRRNGSGAVREAHPDDLDRRAPVCAGRYHRRALPGLRRERRGGPQTWHGRDQARLLHADRRAPGGR